MQTHDNDEVKVGRAIPAPIATHLHEAAILLRAIERNARGALDGNLPVAHYALHDSAAELARRARLHLAVAIEWTD